MKTKTDLLDKTFELMRDKNLTYREARRELGRRGAAARANKRMRRERARSLMERMGLS